MTYRETLRPPIPFIAILAVLAASFGLIVVPLSVGLSAAIAAVLGGAVALVMIATSPQIEVTGSQLRARTAHIDARFFGEITVLDREQTRAAFGPEADLRAWSLYRSFTKGCVKIEINDPRDPTPYWLVCTNRPAELAAALDGARQLQSS